MATAGTITLHPITAVIAVTIRAGEVLLVRRRNPPDAGLWGFPGGKIEFGETVTRAALRELAEETGVQAEGMGAFTAVDAFDKAEDGTLRRHFVLIAVRCRWLSGEPVAADDALEARWYPLSMLEDGKLSTSLGVAEVARLALVQRG